jgi:hypothetical protein
MANKTWNKTKSVMAAGWCNVCKKEMLSDAGGWIVNAEKNTFVMMEKMVVVLISI